MKIDKFSFFVGVLTVVLIIGCIGQVTPGDNSTNQRYQFVPATGGDYVGTLQNGGVGQVAFSVLDTDTGTMYIWNTQGSVTARAFVAQ